MEGEIGRGTAYGSNVQFIRTLFWEKQNEEMIQGTKIYDKLELIIKRYTKVCEVLTGLKWFRICRGSSLFCKR